MHLQRRHEPAVTGASSGRRQQRLPLHAQACLVASKRPAALSGMMSKVIRQCSSDRHRQNGASRAPPEPPIRTHPSSGINCTDDSTSRCLKRRPPRARLPNHHWILEVYDLIHGRLCLKTQVFSCPRARRATNMLPEQTQPDVGRGTNMFHDSSSQRA